MDAPYQDIVAQLRFAFPKPVSDRMHDAYFVFSFLRALDQVDALKSAAPMLGAPVTLDYAEALGRRLEDAPRALETVTAELVQYLSGMFIWGHPRAQINVVPSPTIASLIGGLLPSIYNPNLVSEETSRRVSLAEVEAVAMTASLIGYDPASRRPTTTRCASTNWRTCCTASPRPARGSRASSPRWARPTRSASTTSRAS